MNNQTKRNDFELYSVKDGKLMIGKRKYDPKFLYVSSIILMFLGLTSACISVFGIINHGLLKTDILFIVAAIVLFLYGYLYGWICKDYRFKFGNLNVLDKILYSRGEWLKSLWSDRSKE